MRFTTPEPPQARQGSCISLFELGDESTTEGSDESSGRGRFRRLGIDSAAGEACSSFPLNACCSSGSCFTRSEEFEGSTPCIGTGELSSSGSLAAITGESFEKDFLDKGSSRRSGTAESESSSGDGSGDTSASRLDSSPVGPSRSESASMHSSKLWSVDLIGGRLCSLR